MNAGDTINKALELVTGDRAKQHGDKADNHSRIAALWNGWMHARRDIDGLDKPLTAHDVAIMMVLLKAARTQTGVHNIDDYVDMAGYAGVAAEIASGT